MANQQLCAVAAGASHCAETAVCNVCYFNDLNANCTNIKIPCSR